MDSRNRFFLLFSGKRKSGKDYLTEKLLNCLGTNDCEIIRISEPIKKHWAQEKSLDFKELLSDGPYKEKYRKEMIQWSDTKRIIDPGYFCAAAVATATKPIVIVSDIRRKTDLKFFYDQYGKSRIITIKIHATDTTRKSRGWQYTDGVDNVTSECDLDDYDLWDLEIDNDDENIPCEIKIGPILKKIQTKVHLH